jgi:hypothetical protein
VVIRRPKRVQLAESAYVAPAVDLVPDYLSDLETVPGRCYSPDVVELNCPGVPGIICTKCALSELGETLTHLQIRTHYGTPKAVYYRNLDRAYAEPDPEFRRQFNRSRTWVS